MPTPPESNQPRGDTGGRARGRRPDVWELLDDLSQGKKEQAKLLTNSIDLKMVLIPAGVYQMGSPETEEGRRICEGPVHEVTLRKSFYLGVFPVTQLQYLGVMETNPSRFNHKNGGGGDHPVERVSWNDAVIFCRKLTEIAEEKAAKRLYRLPTEAEWEYACRAGTTMPFAFGTTLTSAQANCDGNYPYGDVRKERWLERTTPVGAFPANHFGLHDMHGNVWEWCADWYGDLYYRQSVRNDPTGLGTGSFRVVRGGSWRNHATTCRSAYRNGLMPHHRDNCTGFRVLMLEDARIGGG
jgi:formylglycine-generating enzyme required for sulfatase activity